MRIARETQLHGLAAPHTSSPRRAWLASLDGGFGYLTHRLGWSCGNVMAFDLVTVHGQDTVARLVCHTGDPSEAERLLLGLNRCAGRSRGEG